MNRKRLSIRSFLRIALAISLLVGCGLAFHYNQRLQSLQQAHAALKKASGLLEVDDPNKVTITRIPETSDIIPPGVSQAMVWRYRIHLPANYDPWYYTKNGLITADSARTKNTGFRSGSGQKSNEPVEVVATLGLVKTDGNWILSDKVEFGKGGSSAGSSRLNRFEFDSTDDLVIDPVVNEGETRTFDVRDPICLIRLRSKQLAKNRKGETEKEFYPGVVVYVVSGQYRSAFEDWSRGKYDSMEEAIGE